MAPALASASAHTDSIKGLAQSIAKPAYRRLLVAEPALRRAVPVLIIAFLVTIAVGAALQVHRPSAAGDRCRHQRDRRGRRPAGRAARPGGSPSQRRDLAPRPGHLLDQMRPARATDGAREIYLTDTEGTVIASVPPTGGERPQASRHSRPGAAADDLRRQRRRSRNSARGRRRRLRHRARAERAVRPAGDHPTARQRAGPLAFRYGADHHAVGDHRLRRPHSRLRFPLAVDPGARSRHDLRDRARPHRHRAQPRPLRTVGLGPRPRPHLLVALDVRDPRPRAARRSPDLRRGQRPRPSRRRRALRARRAARRRQDDVDRPRLPHAPRPRRLGLAAGALRDHLPERRPGLRI